MRNPLLKVLLVLVSVVAVAMIAVFIRFQISPAGAPPPLPIPNAYPALVQAAHTILIPPEDFHQMNREQLQALLASNSVALQVVRTNLNEKIQVPLQYSVAFSSTHLGDLAKFKQIAQVFLADGRLAEMEQRPGDAANSSLDTIRLGVECPRGGLLIDALVGMAIESMGVSELEKLADNLDQKTCKEAAKELEGIDRERQTFDQTLRQEHYWSSKAFPGVQFMLARLFTSRSARASEAKGEQKFKTDLTNTRELMIHLAARAYKLENGHPPAKTADLTPNYLSTIPLDPFTDTNMTYLP